MLVESKGKKKALKKNQFFSYELFLFPLGNEQNNYANEHREDFDKEIAFAPSLYCASSSSFGAFSALYWTKPPGIAAKSHTFRKFGAESLF